MFQSPRQKKSPLKSQSLRYAGQSLDERIQDIVFDKILFSLVVFFMIFAITLNEWLIFYSKTSPHPIFWTVASLLVGSYSFVKFRKHKKEINSIKLGRDGEKIVGESLEALRESGYKVYHDIIGDNFNIDHILVGPGGVFTIETKTISKSIKGNPKIFYNGTNLDVDGFIPDRSPIEQARGQKYWLESFIAERTKLKKNVTPVVLYPGWYINKTADTKDVMVLNHNSLPMFVKKRPQLLNQDEVNLIATHIESYVRNL